MAQVWLMPAETEAQPEETPVVVATSTGTVMVEVLPSAMPRPPLDPSPAHQCEWSSRRASLTWALR